jgi:hypothetical protein
MRAAGWMLDEMEESCSLCLSVIGLILSCFLRSG